MKRLLTFLFILFMCLPALSQNNIGVWTMEKSGIDDSLNYDLKSLIKFEKNGTFLYGYQYKLGNSVYFNAKKGNWKVLGSKLIKIIVRIEETKDYTKLFHNLDFLNYFRYDGKLGILLDENLTKIKFKKISSDGGIEKDSTEILTNKPNGRHKII